MDICDPLKSYVQKQIDADDAPSDGEDGEDGKDGENGYKITSLVESATDEKTAEIYKVGCTHNSMINVGDVLIRVFIDDDMKEPIVLALKVSEITGDFGTYMLINQQCICALETEDFDKKTLDIIGKMAERRLNLNF